MHYRILFFTVISLLFSCSDLMQQTQTPIEQRSLPLNISIPVGGNSWMTENGEFTYSNQIMENGIRNWTNPSQRFRIYFHSSKAGKVSLGLRAASPSGPSTLRINFAGEDKVITVESTQAKEIKLGDFNLKLPGYHYVELAGIEKSGSFFADVNDLLIGTEATIKYIKDDFYFARRGPSVHLWHQVPNEIQKVEWFYSELMVPAGQDVIGSYFMANGFGEGYFGIQVNSPTERKILFSVWSPYQTDNPNDIPEDYKIRLLKKGNDVTTGKFGNEGSGGQSFKVFNWKANVNYGFLIGARPTGNGSTDFTAYFFDPATAQWHLIASFRRPKTDTYLTGLYSFLENFIPEQGVFDRMGYYDNQWVYDANGWHELSEVTFTADNTARKENRLDYSGGSDGKRFYLRNCGFTNNQVAINSQFQRRKANRRPNVDFSRLE